MRSTSLTLPVVLLACACGDKSLPTGNTPRAVATRFMVAIVTHDNEAVRACTIGPDIDREHMRAFLEFWRAEREFHDKFIESYGEEGWTVFNDEEGAQLSFSGAQTREEALAQAAEMKIEVTGDSAIVTRSDTTDELHMIRKDGRWYVALHKTMPLPEKKMIRDTSNFHKLAELLQAKTARIGAPGVTPDSLDEELGGEMMLILAPAGR